MQKYRLRLLSALLICGAGCANAQHCTMTEAQVTLSPQMLQWDNQGQTMVSNLYYEGGINLLERSRQWTVCQTRELGTLPRLVALSAQALLGFRLQYANAYVLHEYAHAEAAYRLQFKNVRVGADDGDSLKASSYFSNLVTMAFDPRQISDFTRRGVSVDWVGEPLTAMDSAQVSAAGLNLHSHLAWQSYQSMLHGNFSPTAALGYTVNKWFSPVYFALDQRIGGDPSTYIKDLAAQGVDTSKSDIQQVQVAAALLSHGTWTSIRALSQYGDAVSDSKPLSWAIKAPGVNNNLVLYWPEFSSYLNQRGVSLGGDVSMAAGGAWWTLGLERNVIGQNQGTDLSLGLTRRASNALTLTGRFTLNQGHGFASIQGQYRLNPRVGLTGLVYGAQGDTLVGQRLAFRSRNGGYVGLNIYF